MKKTQYALAISLAACVMSIQPTWSHDAVATDATSDAELAFNEPIITAMALPTTVLEALALPTAVIDGKRFNVLGQADENMSYRKYREQNTLRANKHGDGLYGSHVRISIGLGAAFAY